MCRLDCEAPLHLYQPKSMKVPASLLASVMDACSLWLKRRGEARLHGAARRLSGLCLVGSWQTATGLTD